MPKARSDNERSVQLYSLGTARLLCRHPDHPLSSAVLLGRASVFIVLVLVIVIVILLIIKSESADEIQPREIEGLSTSSIKGERKILLIPIHNTSCPNEQPHPVTLK